MKKAALRSLASISLLFLFSACAQENLKLYLEIKIPDRVDMSGFETLLFCPLEVTGLPEGLDASFIQDDFFLGDFPRQNRLKGEKIEWSLKEPENIPADTLRELSSRTEKALLVTGRMDVRIKSHSQVRERRDPKLNKRIRSIVKNNQMIIKTDLYIYGVESGKLLWKRSYSEQENEYPGERDAFTLRSLFYRTTDRFSRDIGLQERRVRRTLLEE